jgi:phosphoenolpyruvate-protein phosphotransferase (PTS system enzyme I)
MDLRGIPAAPGFARGPAKLLKQRAGPAPKATLPPGTIADEIGRFLAGRETYREQLEAARRHCLERGAATEAALLDGHLELLMDEELGKDICETIRARQVSAESAAESVLDEIIQEMEQIEDLYARQRSFDFRDLKNKLIRGILGGGFEAFVLDSPAVLVGREIGPSDTATLNSENLLAVVSDSGGATSHLAIFSQNLGIPAVVGVTEATDRIQDGDDLLIDGCVGRVLVRPSSAEIVRFEDNQRAYSEELRLLGELQGLPAVTRDGVPLALLANADGDAGVELALRLGADGVGLFRTEFLYLQRDVPPSEEEQFRVYRKVVTRMQGRSTVFRTFDVGGDKPLACFPDFSEANPFLGWRGMRVYVDWPDLLRTQLRAICRASHYGPVKVMFPMVISAEEVLWLLAFSEQVRSELRQEGLPFDADLPLGIMIETPAAALIAEKLIKQVDFFSVGTNDLTQYTLAVDRGNQRVAGLYDPLHPAVLKLIAGVVVAAGTWGKPVSICGEMTGDEAAAVILLGLGLRALSVSPARILRIKRAIRQIDLATARALASAALQQSTAREVRELIADRQH